MDSSVKSVTKITLGSETGHRRGKLFDSLVPLNYSPESPLKKHTLWQLLAKHAVSEILSNSAEEEYPLATLELMVNMIMYICKILLFSVTK